MNSNDSRDGKPGAGQIAALALIVEISVYMITIFAEEAWLAGGAAAGTGASVLEIFRTGVGLTDTYYVKLGLSGMAALTWVVLLRGQHFPALFTNRVFFITCILFYVFLIVLGTILPQEVNLADFVSQNCAAYGLDHAKWRDFLGTAWMISGRIGLLNLFSGWVLFASGLTICAALFFAVVKSPGVWRGRMASRAAHVSILAIMLGALLGRLFGYRGQMIVEGKAPSSAVRLTETGRRGTVELDFAVAVERATVEAGPATSELKIFSVSDRGRSLREVDFGARDMTGETIPLADGRLIEIEKHFRRAIVETGRQNVSSDPSDPAVTLDVQIGRQPPGDDALELAESIPLPEEITLGLSREYRPFYRNYSHGIEIVLTRHFDGDFAKLAGPPFELRMRSAKRGILGRRSVEYEKLASAAIESGEIKIEVLDVLADRTELFPAAMIRIDGPRGTDTGALLQEDVYVSFEHPYPNLYPDLEIGYAFPHRIRIAISADDKKIYALVDGKKSAPFVLEKGGEYVFGGDAGAKIAVKEYYPHAESFCAGENPDVLIEENPALIFAVRDRTGRAIKTGIMKQGFRRDEGYRPDIDDLNFVFEATPGRRKDFRYALSFSKGGGDSVSKTAALGAPAEFRGVLFYRPQDDRPVFGDVFVIGVVRDPGIRIVYAGLLGLCIAVVGFAYTRNRRAPASLATTIPDPHLMRGAGFLPVLPWLVGAAVAADFVFRIPSLAAMDVLSGDNPGIAAALITFWAAGAIYLLYFTRLLGGRWGMFADGLCLAAAITTGVVVCLKWRATGAPPMHGLRSTFVLLALLTGLLGALAAFRRYARFLSFAGAALASLLLVRALVTFDDGANQPLLLRSVWFVPHVVAYLFGYAALALAAAMSAVSLYLKYIRVSEGVDLGVPGRRMFGAREFVPSESAERLLAVGFAGITIGITIGAVWAQDAWMNYWHWDAKEAWALVSWLIYAAVIHVTRQNRTVACVLNVVGAAAILITYLGLTFLPAALQSLHIYGK